MPLNTGTTQRTYLSITDGRVALRCNEDTPKAVKYTSKEGNVRYELHYPSVTGLITDIKVRDGKYGEELCVEMNDGKEVFELQMKLDSRYASGFFMVLPSIDLSKEVTLTPWMKVVDGKKKTNLYVTHKGEQESIEWFYTKDNPKGLPDLEVRTNRKGEKEYSSDARISFFLEHLETVIKPALQAVNKPLTSDLASDFEDDIPF